MHRAVHRASNLIRDEEGSLSVAAVLLLLASLMVGSLAVDFSRREAAQMDLQITADIAAHAALLRRQIVGVSASDAIDQARDVALGSVVDADIQAALTTADFTFGRWDEDTRVFTADPDARKAIRVVAQRSAARRNYLKGMLTHLMNIAGFEISATSVVLALNNLCTQNGLSAVNKIDLSSNNTFGDDYCIHSDSAIAFNNSNSFGSDSVVSLPDMAALTLPGGVGSNPGLADALRVREAHLHVQDFFDQYDARIQAGDPEYIPAGVSFSWDNVTTVTNKMDIAPGTLAAGAVHVLTCSGSSAGLRFDAGTFTDLVIWTTCTIKFSSGSAFENVVIVQRNTDPKAMDAPNGVRFGAIDGCAPTGDTTIMTSGGFNVASGLQMHGATIAAVGPVKFAASAGGMNGASIMSGDTIQMTSGGTFGTCESQRAFPMKQFRFVL